MSSIRAFTHQNSETTESEIEQKPALILRKSWTLGDSNALVDGHPTEHKLVGLLWIAVPTMLALAVIYFMVPR